MKEVRILLVEDNSNDEELVLRVFKKNNIPCKVIITRDGSEALDYLFRKGAYASNSLSDIPQVILLDLNLPKIGGIDVLRKIRSDEKLKCIPVIILTSSKEEKDLIEGYHLGANSYVVKPVDFIQFSEAVKELGLYWVVRNQQLPE